MGSVLAFSCAHKVGETDIREQLANGGECGPIERVSLSADAITSLQAVMIDVDPRYIRPDLYAGGTGSEADRLYDRCVRRWLANNPVLAQAQVRASGTGLHVLLRLDPPVEFRTAGERQRWGGIFKAIQAIFPSDPNAPGITALTRPVGSVNGKSDQAVRELCPGMPVTPAAVEALYGLIRSQRFATLCTVLFGTKQVSPCPRCAASGSVLSAGSRVGRCYRCGEVTLAALMDLFVCDPDGQGG